MSDETIRTWGRGGRTLSLRCPEPVEGSKGRRGGGRLRWSRGAFRCFDTRNTAQARRTGGGGRTRGLLRLRGGAWGDGRHPRAPGVPRTPGLGDERRGFRRAGVSGRQTARRNRLVAAADGGPMNQVRKLCHLLRWYADRLPNGFTVVREAGVRFAGDRVGHGRTEDRGTEISDDRFQGKLGAVRMQARRPRSHWAGGSSWARGST